MKISSLALTGVALTALTVLPAGAASAKAPAGPHDFNGDGRTDLVVNGPEAVRRGEIGPGVVAVLYGKTHRRQVVTRDSRGVASVADHGDGFGESTASADFDRDGDVDGDDLADWLLHSGLSQCALKQHGDADGDGDVDSADEDIWDAEVGGM